MSCDGLQVMTAGVSGTLIRDGPDGRGGNVRLLGGPGYSMGGKRVRGRQGSTESHNFSKRTYRISNMNLVLAIQDFKEHN